MMVLGIETSCDETAAAIVASMPPGSRIRSNTVHTQLADHAIFGGVVPEVAARAHLDHLDSVVGRALADANASLTEIDAIAAAAGPGLIGGLVVGTTMAKGIAWASGKPFIAVNHLEAHALTARLTHDVAFPYLLLLVSGGHCQLLACIGVGAYVLLGSTLDDAAGEAFDKTAKLIGLGYPGGPAIEQAAREGDANRFALPRPLKGRPGCEFSFSGLKTAVRQLVARLGGLIFARYGRPRRLGGARDLRCVDRPNRKRSRVVPAPPPGGKIAGRGRWSSSQFLAAPTPGRTRRDRRTVLRRAAAGALHG